MSSDDVELEQDEQEEIPEWRRLELEMRLVVRGTPITLQPLVRDIEEWTQLLDVIRGVVDMATTTLRMQDAGCNPVGMVFEPQERCPGCGQPLSEHEPGGNASDPDDDSCWYDDGWEE